MTIINAIEDALREAVKWIGMILNAFYEWISISEWAIIAFAITFILGFLGISIRIHTKNR